MRGYLAGSGWKDYRRDRRDLRPSRCRPALRESDRLPEPIFTPSTKAEAGAHDENIDLDRDRPDGRAAVDDRRGAAVAGELAEQIRAAALALYGYGVGDRRSGPASSWPTRSSSSACGPTGELLLIDEVTDPRLVALLGRRGVRAGPRRRRASTSSSCATGCETQPWDKTAARAGPAGRGRRGHARPATSRRSNGSPAPASRAISRRTSSPDEHVDGIPVRRQRHARGRASSTRRAGPSRAACPTSASTGVSAVRVGRRVELTVEAADARPRRGRSSTGWPASCWQPAHRGVRDRAHRRDVGDHARPTASPEVRRPMIRIGVVVFPGSNCDLDALNALRARRRRAVVLWHESARPRRASTRSPARRLRLRRLPAGRASSPGSARSCGPSAAFAADGGLVLGICNGFQVLAEAGLVPGALLRNRVAAVRLARGRDRAGAARLRRSPARCHGRGPLRMPVAHGEGCYFADAATLDALEARRRRPVPLRPRRRPAGRRRGRSGEPERLARGRSPGSSNAAGNVRGLMPHPERASRPLLGSDDGLGIIRSLVESAAERRGARAGRRRRR